MSDPVNAADAIVQAETMLGEEGYSQLERYLENITMENLLGQIVVIIIAYGLGWWLSRRVNAYATLLVPKDVADQSFKAQLRRGLMHIVHAVSMSFVTGCLVSLGTWILLRTLHVGQEALLCRIAYNVMFAYGILLVLLTFLRALVGEKHVTPAVRRYVSYAFWLLVILQFFGVLGDIILTLDEIRLPIGSGGLSLWKLLLAFITICLTIAVANALGNGARRFIDEKSGWTPNLKIVVSRVVYVFFMILAVVFGLGAVGIDLTVLSVFGGALGVGLGFGLQKIASNYISGFIILIDRSIKIGDLVEAAGFRGRVTQINTRYTVVRNNDGIECIVPNENFVTSPVVNHSYTEEAAVQYISISIAYDADIDRALAIMLEEGMRERPRIVPGRKGWSYLESFGDSGINLKLGFWVKDPVNGTASLRTAISTAIYRRFVEEGIEVPYNRLEINLRDAQAPAVHVKVETDTVQVN